MSVKVFRSARLISVLTLVSRVLGLGRDMACSYAFGVGAIMSAWTIAFQIPNLFRRLFGEGALTAASVPVFTERYTREGVEGLDDLAGRVVGLLAVLLGGISVVADLVMLLIVWCCPLDETAGLILRLTIITLPFSALICVTALLGSLQNVMGRFAPAAAAPIVLNVFMIAGALGGSRLEPRAGIVVLAVAVVLAGIAQVVWLAWGLRRAGLRLRLRIDWHNPYVRRIAITMLPMTAGLGAVQLNALLDPLLALWFVDDSGPAILSYAQRLYQFPLGVFAIALATAIFPALSRHAAEGDLDGLGRSLSRGICVASFEALPCALGMIVVRYPLIELLFNRGEFARAEDAVGRVAFALLMYALGIWAFGINQLIVRAFYATGDVRTPLKASIANVVVNFGLNLVLVQTPLREAGLALSSAITGTLQVSWLLWRFDRKLRVIEWRLIAGRVLRIVVAAAIMAMAVA
ncbi:MAG TPA: murein biosynthesis integral membrane protein MurJ, partial [Phycisphaerae bacterium]|nr:murein biosynthesis integral membrane protein MurJ [Phycisphaerae bacterium]